MVARTERRRYRLGRGGVLRGGEGGVAGRHVARGQLDGGGGGEGALFHAVLYGGSDLRVSFAKSSHVVELHFFVDLFGGRITSSWRTFPKLPPPACSQSCANTAREVASGPATSDLRRAAHGG